MKLYKTAVGVFGGKVKQLNNKEILIENDFKQLLSISAIPQDEVSQEQSDN